MVRVHGQFLPQLFGLQLLIRQHLVACRLGHDHPGSRSRLRRSGLLGSGLLRSILRSPGLLRTRLLCTRLRRPSIRIGRTRTRSITALAWLRTCATRLLRTTRHGRTTVFLFDLGLRPDRSDKTGHGFARNFALEQTLDGVQIFHFLAVDQ